MISFYFESVEEAETYAEELEGECKSLKYTLENNFFEDAYTERVMRNELKQNEAKLEELYQVINQIRFPLL